MFLLQYLKCAITTGTSTTGQLLSGCSTSELDKQMAMWERRVKGIRRMILGWNTTNAPEPPAVVDVDVTSTHSVNVRIHEASKGSLTTKYKGIKYIIYT